MYVNIVAEEYEDVDDFSLPQGPAYSKRAAYDVSAERPSECIVFHVDICMQIHICTYMYVNICMKYVYAYGLSRLSLKTKTQSTNPARISQK